MRVSLIEELRSVAMACAGDSLPDPLAVRVLLYEAADALTEMIKPVKVESGGVYLSKEDIRRIETINRQREARGLPPL